MTTFKDLDLSNQLFNSIKELCFTHPTPIQEAVYYPIYKGKNVTEITQPSAGKTLVYMTSILRDLKFYKQITLRVLAVVPTRKFLIQLY